MSLAKCVGRSRSAWLTVHGLAFCLTFLHLALAQIFFLALKLLGGGHKKLKGCFKNISLAAVGAWILQLRDSILLSSLLLAFSWPFMMLAILHLENLPTLSKLSVRCRLVAVSLFLDLAVLTPR